jgi:hypothetical protein
MADREHRGWRDASEPLIQLPPKEAGETPWVEWRRRALASTERAGPNCDVSGARACPRGWRPELAFPRCWSAPSAHAGAAPTRRSCRGLRPYGGIETPGMTVSWPNGGMCVDSVAGTKGSTVRVQHVPKADVPLKGRAGEASGSKRLKWEIRTSPLAPEPDSPALPAYLPLESLAGEPDEPSLLGPSVPSVICSWQPLAGPWSKH